jgi:hypothetical protein
VPVTETSSALMPDIAFYNLVQHELTHQLASEGLRHQESPQVTTNPTPPAQPCYWVGEGLATWMETLFWNHDTRTFEQRFVRQLALEANVGAIETHLARGQRLGKSMKRIDEIAVQTKEEFWSGGLQAYSQAVSWTLFLLQRSPASRAAFMRLAILVHTYEATKESFAQLYKGDQLGRMDGEMLTWLEAIKFEE